MPQLQGLIFDLDGTLLDSAPDLRHTINALLGAHGRRELTLNEVGTMLGSGLTTIPFIAKSFAITGASLPDPIPYELVQEFLVYHHNQKPDPVQIYPGAVEVLETMQKAGVKLGLCTNKQEAATRRLLEQLDLMKYFTFVAGGDTFPVHKPNPGHVLGVLAKLGTTAANAVMIGDSSNDVLAAHGAGMRCFAVTHGYGVDVANLGADAVLESFTELSAALSRHFELPRA